MYAKKQDKGRSCADLYHGWQRSFIVQAERLDHALQSVGQMKTKSSHGSDIYALKQRYSGSCSTTILKTSGRPGHQDSCSQKTPER